MKIFIHVYSMNEISYNAENSDLYITGKDKEVTLTKLSEALTLMDQEYTSLQTDYNCHMVQTIKIGSKKSKLKIKREKIKSKIEVIKTMTDDAMPIYNFEQLSDALMALNIKIQDKIQVGSHLKDVVNYDMYNIEIGKECLTLHGPGYVSEDFYCITTTHKYNRSALLKILKRKFVASKEMGFVILHAIKL